MKNNKSNIEWLMTHCEQCSQRYIEAEEFILNITSMSFPKRLLYFPIIYKMNLFILSQQAKYKF